MFQGMAELRGKVVDCLFPIAKDSKNPANISRPWLPAATASIIF